MTTSRPRARELLSGTFGWFFAGRAVDLFGSGMTPVALALAVLEASGRASDLGLVLAANIVPTLALTLLGGALADRHDRRTVLVLANLVTFATTGALALILIAGQYSLPAAMGLMAVAGAASAFTGPALRGIVPELVSAPRLQQANALLGSVRTALRIISPSVAALLVATVGGGWAIAVDAATSLLAAALLARLPATRIEASGTTVWRDLAEGWATFGSLRWLVALSVSGLVLNAANVGPWNILGPLLVGEDDGALAWGLVVSVRALGLFVGSALLLRWSFTHPLRAGRVVGTAAALPLLCLGLGAPVWCTAAAAFVGAIGFAISGITWDTALQTHVPREQLSRVSAYDDLLSFVAIPLSQVATAPLASALGASRLALIAAGVYVVASLAPLAVREVRQLR